MTPLQKYQRLLAEPGFQSDPAQRHASALEMQAELTAMLRILDQMSKSEDDDRGLGT